MLSGRYSDETIIGMYQNGDSDMIDEIFERYKSRVRRKAKAMYIAGGDEEDLIQEGMIGLYKAVRDFDDTKEASFSTFASMCINRQMCTAVAAANRKKYQPLNESISLDMPVLTEAAVPGDSQTHLIDVLKSSAEQNPETLYLDKEQVDNIRSAIDRCLSPYEKQVLEMYMKVNDYTMIARTLEKPAKSIDNALQRIRSKIRAEVSGREISKHR